MVAEVRCRFVKIAASMPRYSTVDFFVVNLDNHAENIFGCEVLTA
jgi:hypothetical protein